MNLTSKQRSLIVEGLYMKKNFIETHNPCLSAQDLKNIGDKNPVVLMDEQIELIFKINELLTTIFAHSVIQVK